MHKYEHKQLIKRILKIDQTPEEDVKFGEWIQARQHLELLASNANEGEFIAYASGPFAFVHTALIDKALIDPLPIDDLLNWGFSSTEYRTSLVMRGDSDRYELDDDFSWHGSETLRQAQHLIFNRIFDGWKGSDRHYVEVLQEYAHVAGIHWRNEHGAYCKFDDEGDVAPTVSVSQRGENQEDITLVSFERDSLDEFLAAGDFALVRVFDFTLLRRSNFNSYGDGPESVSGIGGQLHYKQKVAQGHAAYTRGFQLIEPRRGYQGTHEAMREAGWHSKPKGYVEFWAHDWRNDTVCKISTDPIATTNYFATEGNNLPFELSPAFFKPEVLLKYKSDRDKYTVETRRIHCRATWTLRGYDINEAGQVHAYIGDLRNLPLSEQQHWLSHNERPKAGLSSRAITTDFHGQWTDEIDPLDTIKAKLRSWKEASTDWWKPTTEEAFDNVTTPSSSSRDEWAQAFMDLSQLVIEGFRIKPIRKAMDAAGVTYKANSQSIILLENLRSHNLGDDDKSSRLSALRSIQHIRSKVKGHSGSSEADSLAKSALREHGSYGSHFSAICTELDNELAIIEELLQSNRS